MYASLPPWFAYPGSRWLQEECRLQDEPIRIDNLHWYVTQYAKLPDGRQGAIPWSADAVLFL
jgi:hypothetical protein